jgi:Ca2+-binding RTX toxin-like protein
LTNAVQTDPNVIVVTAANQSLDLSGINDTTVLAVGTADQINMVGESYEGGEGSGNTVVLTGYESGVAIGYSQGTGDNDIQLLGPDETVTGEAFPGSNDTIEVGGKNAAINIGGYNQVVLNSTDNTVTIEPTLVADSEDPFGENTVIANGIGKETVTGGGADFTFTGDDGHYVVSGGSAEHTTISGGSGGGLFTGGYFTNPNYSLPGYGFYSGDNVITAGTQASTLVGALHGSSLLMAAGSAHDVLMAGEYGNDTLSGGTATGNNLYEGYAGPYVASDDPATPSLVIEAGSGNDTLVAGLATETLTGGGGRDLFRFFNHAGDAIPPGGNNTVITDFTLGVDKIDLRGFGVISPQVVADDTVIGGSTILRLPDGEQITLLHVTTLSDKNFTQS